MDGFIKTLELVLLSVSVITMVFAGGFGIHKLIISLKLDNARINIRFAKVRIYLKALYVKVGSLRRKITLLNQQANQNKETICELQNKLKKIQMQVQEINQNLQVNKAINNFAWKDIYATPTAHKASESSTRVNLQEGKSTLQSVKDILTILQQKPAYPLVELVDKLGENDIARLLAILAIYITFEQNKLQQRTQSDDAPLFALNKIKPHNTKSANH